MVALTVAVLGGSPKEVVVQAIPGYSNTITIEEKLCEVLRHGKVDSTPANKSASSAPALQLESKDGFQVDRGTDVTYRERAHVARSWDATRLKLLLWRAHKVLHALFAWGSMLAQLQVEAGSARLARTASTPRDSGRRGPGCL